MQYYNKYHINIKYLLISSALINTTVTYKYIVLGGPPKRGIELRIKNKMIKFHKIL